MANYQEQRPLDPDYDQYIVLNDLGSIRMFTAREDGKLIAYAVFYIANNLHYKTWKYASSDIYYLDPEYRNKGLGKTFFEETEAWLKSLGVNNIVVQDKTHHSHEKFFKYLGYNVIEQVYEKLI